MDILLIDFSGTGHTTLCGDFIAANFIEQGHHVDHFTYKADKEINVDFDKLLDLRQYVLLDKEENLPEDIQMVGELKDLVHFSFGYNQVEDISVLYDFPMMKVLTMIKLKI